MDFVHDQLATRRKLRVLTIVDIFSRFSSATEVRSNFRRTDMVEVLERVGHELGFPLAIRVDQGTVFVSRDRRGGQVLAGTENREIRHDQSGFPRGIQAQGYRREEGPHEERFVGWRDIGAQPIRGQFGRDNWADRCDFCAAEAGAQPVLAAVQTGDLDQPPHLSGTRQCDGIDRALRQFVNRMQDVRLGDTRVIDVRQHRIDLSAPRFDAANQYAVILIRVQLQSNPSAVQVEPRQHVRHAFRGWPVGRYGGVDSDIAQCPAGLRAAGKGARLPDRRDERLIDAHTARHLQDAPQPFAGHEHQIVRRRIDRAFDPGLNRRRVGRVLNGEHRALQDVSALFRQKVRELRSLAGLKDQNTETGKSVSHDCSSALYRVHFAAALSSGARALRVIEQGANQVHPDR